MSEITVHFQFKKVGDEAAHRRVKHTVETPAPFSTSGLTDAILNLPDSGKSNPFYVITLPGEFAAEPTEEQLTEAVLAYGAKVREEHAKRMKELAEEERKGIIEDLHRIYDGRFEYPHAAVEQTSSATIGGKWYQTWTLRPQGRAIAEELGILSEVEAKIAEGRAEVEAARLEQAKLQEQIREQTAEREAAQEKAKAASEEEARRWVREYGSPRLQRLYDQGYKWQKAYFRERLQRELGDTAVVYDDTDYTVKDCLEPSLAALKFEELINKRLEELGNPEQAEIVVTNNEEEDEYLFFSYRPGKLGDQYKTKVCVPVPDPGK